MLFKDLKQLGRGRKNASGQKSATDESGLESANDNLSERDTTAAGVDNAAPEGFVGSDAVEENPEIEEHDIKDDAEAAEQVMVNKSTQNEDADDGSQITSDNPEVDQAADGEINAGQSEAHDDAATDASAPDDMSSAEDLNEKVEKYREDYVRAVAELQNVKRRSESDVQKAKKYGAVSMARGLLEVKDSLDLASSVDLSDAREDAIAKMQEGLGLTLKQLEAVLDKHGVRPVEPEMGDKLDPALHQAMSMQPSSAVKPNHVLAVVQKGYQLHDRLLRAAMVVVATAGEPGGSDTNADTGGGSEPKTDSDE